MISIWSAILSRRRCDGLGWRLLLGLLGASLPFSATASVSAKLAWLASSDPEVAGYNIYYGTASQQYTNSVTVGAVTNAVIGNLRDDVTYFFAATAYDSLGNQSEFSNEAAFAHFSTTPGSALSLDTLPENFDGDPLVFALDASAPSGATINPTNGIVSWTPDLNYAATTNYINVNVSDTLDPASDISETLIVVVGGCLNYELGNTAVSAGQTNSLPVTVASSASLTNLQMILNWPSEILCNPTLTILPPVISGSLQNQNGQLFIQLQTAASQSLTGTSQVAQVNFQAAAGQASRIISIPATLATGDTADGLLYSNVAVQAGEVSVVGAQPMLQPSANVNRGRTISLFANPGSYQLQYSTSLAPPVIWTPLMSYQQTNLTQTVPVTSEQPVVFYRLKQL